MTAQTTPTTAHARLRMPVVLCAAIAALATGARGDAANKAHAAVTFNRDVAPLVHARCATCHREGEAGPFPLVDYRDVRKRAAEIVDVTARRIMPPWKAERQPDGLHFVGERRLSDDEIDLLRRWAEQGCPEGDPTAAPEPPRFAAGWQLGEPDQVVTMPQPYTLAAEGPDVYRSFIVPLRIPPGKYLRAVEYRPANRRIVHHAVLTTLPTDAARRLEAAEPKGTGPGFASGLVAPGERLPGPLGIWAPGKDPLPLPDGYAMPWPQGRELMLQLHLHPSGKPETEQSSVGLYFTDEPPTGQLRPEVLINDHVDIAPGDRAYRLTRSHTLERDVEVIGLFPHMHLLGRTVSLTATLPDGTTQSLLSIRDWQFNWQTYYQYATPPRLPAGTTVHAEWTFDNSANNPANPSHPPRRVRFGEQTTDEMGVVILDVIDAQKDARAGR